MASELKPMMKALKKVREENDAGRQAVQAWADSNTRPAPAATDMGLVTVAYVGPNGLSPVKPILFKSQTRELCDRSQAELEIRKVRKDAEELLAAKDQLIQSLNIVVDNFKSRTNTLKADNAALTARVKELGARLFPSIEPEPGEHQEVLDALEAHNSGEEQ